ncbi:MAG: hypothetical protein KGQ59_00325 [Bdellovibrionales bacterium]|nr:hypothetical protein [Bdellovibrionales bacterium]
MGAKRVAPDEENRSGQSLVEFVFMLPLIVGMLVLLIRVNSAIQVSIVNQKYSRQRLFELIANNSTYPSEERGKRLMERKQHRLVVGVSEESTDDGKGEADYSAPTEWITRSKKAALGASTQAQVEPERRAEVRIRNTVEICTPVLFTQMSAGGNWTDISRGFNDKTFSSGSILCAGD